MDEIEGFLDSLKQEYESTQKIPSELRLAKNNTSGHLKTMKIEKVNNKRRVRKFKNRKFPKRSISASHNREIYFGKNLKKHHRKSKIALKKISSSTLKSK